MYINEVIIGVIGAVLGGIIGYLVSASKIKYEYKRKLIHEKTRDFLNDLKIFYQPLGYYSSQLAISSKKLLDEIYLFSWYETPGNDGERFIKFLKDKYKIEWAKTENISKIDDGKTIIVSNKEKSLSLRLNDKKTKVNLKIDDGRVDEFIVKTENDKLEIIKEKIDDITIKKMLFDLGNYLGDFLDLSIKRGYIIFPNYKRNFEIFEYHRVISKAVFNLFQDYLEISSLINISTKCENNFEKFCFELENTNIFSNFKSKLTKDSLITIYKNGKNMYKIIDKSIDHTLKPWYIAHNKKSYENKDKYIKKFRSEPIEEYMT